MFKICKLRLTNVTNKQTNKQREKNGTNILIDIKKEKKKVGERERGRKRKKQKGKTKTQIVNFCRTSYTIHAVNVKWNTRTMNFIA